MNQISGEAEIAVIGAAGATGKVLVKALVKRGLRVRPLVRRENQAALFPDIDDCRAVDLDDTVRLGEALGGVAVVYYIPPLFDASEEKFGANVITAATRAKIGRLVYHSVLHAPTPAMVHHLRKSHVELAIRESDLAWTIVQPAMYSQTPLMFLNQARDALAPGFDITRSFTPIDVLDLCEAVANVLTGSSHEYATYELAGDERLTFAQMAEVMSGVLGHAVTARTLPPQLLIDQAIERGSTPEAAEELRLMMAHYDRHGLMGNGTVLRLLLGRAPARFAETMARELA